MWIYRYEVRTWREPQIFDNNSDIPVVEDPEKPKHWHFFALCSGMEQAIFFGEEIPGRPGMGSTQLAVAKEICGGCPVVRECLTHALTQPEFYGIWAGTSGRMRERMWKRIEQGAALEVVIDHHLDAI